MKKYIFTIVATFFMFISVSTKANAQSYDSSEQAFMQCEMFVQQANEKYINGQFVQAKEDYKNALNCNAYCTGKKFMSDRKLSKRISNCDYAIAHGGVTREQKSQQAWSTLDAILAVGAVAGATAAIVTSDPHHHHDHGYRYHGGYDPHHYHH